MNKSILIIAAHPDDEVLGCGGTIAKFAKQGAKIHVACLADGVSSRQRDIATQQTDSSFAVRRPKKLAKFLALSQSLSVIFLITVWTLLHCLTSSMLSKRSSRSAALKWFLPTMPVT